MNERVIFGQPLVRQADKTNHKQRDTTRVCFHKRIAGTRIHMLPFAMPYTCCGVLTRIMMFPLKWRDWDSKKERVQWLAFVRASHMLSQGVTPTRVRATLARSGVWKAFSSQNSFSLGILMSCPVSKINFATKNQNLLIEPGFGSF